MEEATALEGTRGNMPMANTNNKVVMDVRDIRKACL